MARGRGPDRGHRRWRRLTCRVLRARAGRRAAKFVCSTARSSAPAKWQLNLARRLLPCLGNSGGALGGCRDGRQYHQPGHGRRSCARLEARSDARICARRRPDLHPRDTPFLAAARTRGNRTVTVSACCCIRHGRRGRHGSASRLTSRPNFARSSKIRFSGRGKTSSYKFVVRSACAGATGLIVIRGPAALRERSRVR